MSDLDNDLGPNRQQAIIKATNDPVQRCMYATLNRDELNVNMIMSYDI